MTKHYNNVFSLNQANKIKSLLNDLRQARCSSDKKRIRNTLRKDYNFFLENFGRNLTSDDFNNLVSNGKIIIVEDFEGTNQHQDVNLPTINAVPSPETPRKFDTNAGHNFVICPNCKSQLKVDKILNNNKLLLCPICRCDFKNPIETNLYKKRFFRIAAFIIVVLWILSKCETNNNANTLKTFYQTDRTEIYYHDENGNVEKRKTIYKNGKPDEYKYY